MRQSATQTAMGSGPLSARKYTGVPAAKRASAQDISAEEALAKLQLESAKRGLDRLTMAEIDAEIGASRRERGIASTRGDNY